MLKNPAKWVFFDDYHKNTMMLDEVLRVNESFDIITRVIDVGGRTGKIYFVDGFLKDEVFERIMRFLKMCIRDRIMITELNVLIFYTSVKR